MSNKNFVGWGIARLIGFIIMLALVAGAGFMAYRAGVAQGVMQAPEVAAAIESAAENGSAVAPAYGYGYPHGAYGFRHPHFFNPFGAICGSIFFLFLFFGLMKMVFFRRMMRHRWGHHHGHGEHSHCGKNWEGGVPPMFNEWHKRAHGEKPEEPKTEEPKTE